MSPYKRLPGNMTPEIAKRVIAFKSREKIKWADVPERLGLTQSPSAVRSYCNKILAGTINLNPQSKGRRKKESGINFNMLTQSWS